MMKQRFGFLSIILLACLIGSGQAADSYRVASDGGSYEYSGIYDYYCMVTTGKYEGDYADIPMPVYRLPESNYFIGYRGCSNKWVILNLESGVDGQGCPTPGGIGGGHESGYLFRNFNDAPLPPRTGWENSWHNDDLPLVSAPEVIPVYYLTTQVNGTGCSIARSPSAPRYDDGTSVTLIPQAAGGWAFNGWSGDLSGSANPGAITMDADKTVTATFVGLADYDLLITTNGQGSVGLSPPGGTYYDGTTVTLTAVPADAYWQFTGWSGDLSGSTNPATIGMDAARSVTATFTLVDSDGDGISDQAEDGAPNNGDGNNDGTADRLQSHVACVYTPNQQHQVTLESANGTSLTHVQAGGNPHPEDCPDWAEFPYGFYQFTLTGITPGGATTLTMYLPDDPNVEAPNAYYKYGPLPADPTVQWYRFIYETTTQVGAQFNGRTVTLHLIDGGLGDDDLTANGTIEDVGGPGVYTSSGGGGGPGPSPSSGGGGGGGGGCFLGSLF